MLHLVSTLLFVVAGAFGLTVISMMLGENIDRVIDALLAPPIARRRYMAVRTPLRFRFTRA